MFHCNSSLWCIPASLCKDSSRFQGHISYAEQVRPFIGLLLLQIFTVSGGFHCQTQSLKSCCQGQPDAFSSFQLFHAPVWPCDYCFYACLYFCDSGLFYFFLSEKAEGTSINLTTWGRFLTFDISFASFYIGTWFIYLEYVKCQNLTPKKRECHGSLNLQKSRCRYRKSR